MIIYAQFRAKLHEQSVKNEAENAPTSLFCILIFSVKTSNISKNGSKKNSVCIS